IEAANGCFINSFSPASPFDPFAPKRFQRKEIDKAILRLTVMIALTGYWYHHWLCFLVFKGGPLPCLYPRHPGHSWAGGSPLILSTRLHKTQNYPGNVLSTFWNQRVSCPPNAVPSF